MPCPCFEPEKIASDRQHVNARLPLLSEYDGLCHASGHPAPAPGALRFRCCNLGYSRGICEHFPVSETRSALRYNVTRRTANILEVVCIEEKDYGPHRWHSVEYVVSTAELNPEIEDLCMRAQLLAFCRGYLARLSD